MLCLVLLFVFATFAARCSATKKCSLEDFKAVPRPGNCGKLTISDKDAKVATILAELAASGLVAKLTMLDASHTNIDMEGIKFITENMLPGSSQFPPMEALWLGRNHLDNDKAVVLAQGLASAKALEGVSLEKNNIGSKGAVALAAALKYTTVVGEIHLDDNNIGREGAVALADVLASSMRKLTFFRLRPEVSGFGAAVVETQPGKALTTVERERFTAVYIKHQAVHSAKEAARAPFCLEIPAACLWPSCHLLASVGLLSPEASSLAKTRSSAMFKPHVWEECTDISSRINSYQGTALESFLDFMRDDPVAILARAVSVDVTPANASPVSRASLLQDAAASEDRFSGRLKAKQPKAEATATQAPLAGASAQTAPASNAGSRGASPTVLEGECAYCVAAAKRNLFERLHAAGQFDFDNQNTTLVNVQLSALAACETQGLCSGIGPEAPSLPLSQAGGGNLPQPVEPRPVKKKPPPPLQTTSMTCLACMAEKAAHEFKKLVAARKVGEGEYEKVRGKCEHLALRSCKKMQCTELR